MENDYSIETRMVESKEYCKKFLQSLEELQVPCPWGDLKKGEGLENKSGYIPNVPLTLVVGCGHRMYEEAYRSIALTRSFTKLVKSDIIDPRIMSNDYITIDLIDPESINLFGYKVHAVMSCGVFTYDGLGVNFPDNDSELKCAEALSDLLMPRGFIANDNLFSWNNRFEDILKKEFNFKFIRNGNLDSVILQKPF